MSMTGIEVKDDAQAFRSFNPRRGAVACPPAWAPRMRPAPRAAAPGAAGADAGRRRDRLQFQRRTTVGSMTMLFTDDVPYFDYVIKGTTGGQIIRPVAARALHWSDAGGDYFAKSVVRGDTPANDFPSRVWDRMAEEVQNGFRDKIREGLT